MATWGIVNQGSPDSADPSNLQDLYNNVIELFEGDDADGIWVRDTLSWWNL